MEERDATDLHRERCRERFGAGRDGRTYPSWDALQDRRLAARPATPDSEGCYGRAL